MRNKKGFTLAEALITMGIIGVVAALTLPTLINTNQNKILGNSLSVAVSDFETAMSTMIMRDNVVDIFETKAWRSLEGSSLNSSTTSKMDVFVENLQESFEVLNYGETPNDYYENGYFNYPAKTKSYVIKGVSLETGKNITYFIEINNSIEDTSSLKPEFVLEKGGNMSQKAAMVYIDVNGKKLPNTLAKDIFIFALGHDGQLYPIGGIDYALYITKGVNFTKELWSNSTNCPKNLNGSSFKAAYCAGRVVDNNYKIDY